MIHVCHRISLARDVGTGCVINVFLHHQTKQLKQIKQSRGLWWVSQRYNENMDGVSVCVKTLSIIKYINNFDYKCARLLKH